MGRKKITIKPISIERTRQVTFSKRKNGLLKKAYELSILCKCDIAIVMYSETGKLHQYSSKPMDHLLERYFSYSNLERSAEIRTSEDLAKIYHPYDETDDKEDGEMKDISEDDTDGADGADGEGLSTSPDGTDIEGISAEDKDKMIVEQKKKQPSSSICKSPVVVGGSSESVRRGRPRLDRLASLPTTTGSLASTMAAFRATAFPHQGKNTSASSQMIQQKANMSLMAAMNNGLFYGQQANGMQQAPLSPRWNYQPYGGVVPTMTQLRQQVHSNGNIPPRDAVQRGSMTYPMSYMPTPSLGSPPSNANSRQTEGSKAIPYHDYNIPFGFSEVPESTPNAINRNNLANSLSHPNSYYNSPPTSSTNINSNLYYAPIESLSRSNSSPSLMSRPGALFPLVNGQSSSLSAQGRAHRLLSDGPIDQPLVQGKEKTRPVGSQKGSSPGLTLHSILEALDMEQKDMTPQQQSIEAQHGHFTQIKRENEDMDFFPPELDQGEKMEIVDRISLREEPDHYLAAVV